MKSITDRVIFIIVKLSERYKLQIIQVYAPTSTAEEQQINLLWGYNNSKKI